MTAAFPRIIAHRGFSAEAPENSLSSFRKALELGVEGLEFDVRFSRDRIPMLIHDEKLNRTTNGSGLVRDHARSEIQSLDGGSWFSEDFRGERVPTLPELIPLADPFQPELILELKPDRGIPDDYVARILEPFPGSWLDRLVILSFEHSLLSPFRDQDPRVRIGALVNRRGDAVESALSCGAQVLALRRNLVTKTAVQRAHASGLEIMIWTVDKEREMKRMAEWQVDAIITNRPDRALALKKKGIASR